MTSTVRLVIVLTLLSLVYPVDGSSLVRGVLKKLGFISKQEPPVLFADTQPRIELRLSPPRHPYPEVSAKIEVLDKARRVTEERFTTKLLKSFDEELKRARLLITSLVRQAMESFDDPAVLPVSQKGKSFIKSSFFARPTDTWSDGRVWVTMELPEPVDGVVTDRIEVLEKRNAKSELTEAQTMIEDMHEVTRYFLQQLNETLINTIRPVIQTKGSVGSTAYSSFLALEVGFHRCEEIKRQFSLQHDCKPPENQKQHHEHIVSSFAEEHLYPTVESLVQDMLDRREVDENLFRARSVALMARLAQEESKIAKELLQAAVAAILTLYAPVIHATNMTQAELVQYKQAHPEPGVLQNR